MDHTQEIESIPLKKTVSEITESRHKSRTSVDDIGDADNMDKIRYILFGAQMREQEKWYTRLEQRTFKEINSLKEETKKRFDSLENYVKNEIDMLSDRLQTEQDDRNSSVKDLSKEL